MASPFKTDLPEPRAAHRQRGLRLHDRAYAYLKDLLLDGVLAPGDQISTERIGRVLDVSRAPVSDAIRRLTVDGFLDVQPQVGCRVVTPEPGEVADFYQLFGATEGVIARLAAERRSDEQAADLQRLVLELADPHGLPTDTGQRVAAMRLRNRQRFERLHELAATELSTTIAESFWDRSDFYLRAAFGVEALPSHLASGTLALFRAVVDGDGPAAESRTRETLTRLGHDAARLLQTAA